MLEAEAGRGAPGALAGEGVEPGAGRGAAGAVEVGAAGLGSPGAAVSAAVELGAGRGSSGAAVAVGAGRGSPAGCSEARAWTGSIAIAIVVIQVSRARIIVTSDHMEARTAIPTRQNRGNEPSAASPSGSVAVSRKPTSLQPPP